MPPDFEKQGYWHARFEMEKSFEWLVPSHVFMAILDPYLQKQARSARLLHLGFGTSNLQTHLRSAGFENVTNVDYEPLAIEHGRQHEEDAFGDVRMRYLVADATQLDLPDRYDVVIDKCAADAISCSGDEAVLAIAAAIDKCLADGGIWISLSYSAVRYQLKDLACDVEVVDKIPTPKQRENDPEIYYYCYLLRPRWS
ncbi:S-adenosyl-L-methionine-dependent methyltransferase [Bombardia bombarda]|uniref:S-adenosyl-L-methionine-dependent methyltransferase n=1 Tax=Bombardia bombarda TaxID=252184 RepID=A0AA40C3Z8_9PEZI|nr:S-adenosyl-L-methionine-dependent methyltransferase [Bombardia bombarda]